MQLHFLKIEERYYEAIERGQKTCELRYNDRDYQAGDLIRFITKWVGQDRPSGERFEGDYWVRANVYKITHVLHEFDGLKKDYVILSLKLNIPPKKLKA